MTSPLFPGGAARPGASVVVAVRGNTAALEGLAAALDAQEIPGGIELIVVDNHPTPVLRPGAGRLGPMDCRIVHEPQPGLSRARNTGIGLARGDIVLITDPDARPEPGWASGMVRALEETGAYAAGGRVVPRFTGSTPAAVPPEVMQLFVPPLWPQTTTGLAAPYWVVGCNLAMRRRPRPWFDTRLGVAGLRHLSCEELEFTVRAERDGLRVVVVPDAVVHRAIHPADLRARAVAGRAWWHGVSIARLLAIHPDAGIHDSYRLRDAVTWTRLRHQDGRRAAVTDALRIAGLHTERIHLAWTRLRRPTAAPSGLVVEKKKEGIGRG
ncbi:glycosyltransferase [Streptomyces sp. NBC_01476]|uniref:glycosyltransferase n=1 Tax=Streptomyces sp. NBC_01476 TaxID=2903881 RepID=UPI002E3682FC|nr:glycosyltransferase [Streptomyces sp. NBC_01476]